MIMRRKRRAEEISTREWNEAQRRQAAITQQDTPPVKTIRRAGVAFQRAGARKTDKIYEVEVSGERGAPAATIPPDSV